jgi:putative oxidoreductase
MKFTADPITPDEVDRALTLTPFDWLQAAGRALLSLLFLWDGLQQLLHPAVTVRYFESAHVPFAHLTVWLSILLHLLGGLLLLVGVRARMAAALLSLLALGTAFGVHLPASDPEGLLHFYKNLAIAGGLLYVIACGAGRISIEPDGRW